MTGKEREVTEGLVEDQGRRAPSKGCGLQNRSTTHRVRAKGGKAKRRGGEGRGGGWGAGGRRGFMETLRKGSSVWVDAVGSLSSAPPCPLPPVLGELAFTD